MLDNNDKHYIRDVIRQALEDAKLSGPSANNKVKGSKKNKKPNTIAERVEHEKLRLLKSIPEESLKTLSTITSTITSKVKDVANSQVSKGLYNAFMYSNPVTAFIAENASLLNQLNVKLPKIKLPQNKTQVPKKLNLPAQQSQSSLLVSAKTADNKNIMPTNKFVSTGGTNYIMAKTALFSGGKNYITININGMPMGNYGRFTQNNSTSTPDIIPKLTGPKSKLSLPDGPVIDAKLVSTAKGQLAEAKLTNKLLTSLNKRAVLITAGVLAGVGAILALGLWLKNNLPIQKFKDAMQKPTNSTKRMNNRTDNLIQNSSSLNMLNNNTLGGLLKLSDGKTKKVDQIGFGKKFGQKDMKKLTELVDKKVITQNARTLTLRSGVTASFKKFKNSDNKNMRFKLPVPIRILEKLPSPTDESFVTILIERDTKKRDSFYKPKLVIDHVKGVLAPMNHTVPANTPFAIVGSEYEIIGDIAAFMNGAEYETYQNTDTHQQDVDNLNKFRTPEIINKQEKQDAKIQKDLNLYSSIAETPLAKAFDFIKNGLNEQSQDKPLSVSTNTVDQVNKGNKNVEIAKTQASKATLTNSKPQPIIASNTAPIRKDIKLTAPTNNIKMFGITQPTDLIEATSSVIDIA